MTHQRNTKEAPKLQRCSTCGASEIDGNGPVALVTGTHFECELCNDGAEALIEDRGWFRDETGRLHPNPDEPEHPSLAGERADADQLYTALRKGFEEVELTVEPPLNGRGFTAIVMRNGYRWHVFPRHQSMGSGTYSVRLFTPGREIIPEMQFDLETTDPDEAAERLMALLIVSHPQSGTWMANLIADRSLAEAEIAMFDPNELLGGN